MFQQQSRFGGLTELKTYFTSGESLGRREEVKRHEVETRNSS